MLTRTINLLVDKCRPLQFRGKSRLLEPLVPKTGIRSADVYGARLDLDLDNYIDRMVYFGSYEPLNTFRFKKMLRRGMTMIDVGANIGYFSLLGSKLVGESGKVFAIEPHPKNFQLLSSNIERNRLSKSVHPLQFALGELRETGKVLMSEVQSHHNRTASMVGAEKDTNAVSVETRTLDDCIEEWGITRVDLLKIDVDGYETKIIKGAIKSMAKGIIRNIIIEFNDYWLQASQSSPEELSKIIGDAGFVDISSRDNLPSLLLGASPDRHFSLGS